MATIDVQPDAARLAEAAARQAVDTLNQAITEHDCAVWVLAGGTAPLGAYEVIARNYAAAVPWHKVTFLLGDERCVPLDDPAANWIQISHALLERLPIPAPNKLRPFYELSAERAAEAYGKNVAAFLHFDLVWLGMGEDGHTLSLFPGHASLQPTDALVIPVHDAPKPPPDRISLTLTALQKTAACLVLTSGAAKAVAIDRAKQADANLPIVQAVQTIEAAGGKVSWLIDSTANSSQG
jgi:6-phosphogluconolactonase